MLNLSLSNKIWYKSRFENCTFFIDNAVVRGHVRGHVPVVEHVPAVVRGHVPVVEHFPAVVRGHVRGHVPVVVRGHVPVVVRGHVPVVVRGHVRGHVQRYVPVVVHGYVQWRANPPYLGGGGS